MSFVSEGSTPDLIKKLILNLQGQFDNEKYGRRCIDSRSTFRRLRRIAFETLLFGSHGNYDYGELSPLDRIFAVIFNLRFDAKYNEANQLEACVFKLRSENLLENDTFKNVISLLMILRNEGEVCEDSFLSHPKWHQPFPPLFKPTTPDGPLAYPSIGSSENTFYYTSYPRELFEKSTSDLSSSNSHLWNIDSKIFELPPGSNQFVALPSSSKTSGYLQQLSQTLFGALSHPVNSSNNIMDLRLEIPELGDHSPSISLASYVCGRSSAKSQVSEDEGFTEPETPLNELPTKSTSIWETVLSMEPRTYYTWEDLGSYVIHREKPYLTESGSQTINELEILWQRELQLLHPELIFPMYKTKTSDELLRDISYVLLGISSPCFPFSDKNNKFVAADNINFIGWSHQGLNKLLSQFADSGTYYFRLRKFCEEKLPTSSGNRGLVFRAFTRGIRRVLNYYNALVLVIKPRDTVLGFMFATAKIRVQLESLASLCNLKKHGNTNDSKFPFGMNLLSYLYATAMEVIGSDFYLVILSLLTCSSAPYLKFLHNWVYNGLCDDPFDEFPIKPNESYLAYRDHRYWTKAFVLSYNDACPLIPHNLMAQIHVCGKGVNLLKLCSPQHHLCNSHDLSAPQLKLTCSKSELDSLHWKSAHYASSMESLRKEKCLSWGEIEQRLHDEKKNLEREAILGASSSLERVEKKIAEQREAKIREKRKQMMELQVQIKEAQLRKEREKEEAIKLDKDIQREMEHYQKLHADAEMREKRNDWRSRRMKLNSARVEFLEQDRRMNMLNLSAMHSNKDSSNVLLVPEQPMQISPDQGYSPEICMSESLDSFNANVSLDSTSTTNLKELECGLIITSDNSNTDVGSKTTTDSETNKNDSNENMRTDNENANKAAQRPHLLSLDSQNYTKKNVIPRKINRTKSRVHASSESSGVSDVVDWTSEHNSEINAPKMKEPEEERKNGKELILRLVSEDSSGRDSGMSLQTPASDEFVDEKLDTPMSTLSNTHSSDSVISSFISIEDDYTSPGLALINAGVTMKSRGRSEHGHASESILQSLMCPEKVKSLQQVPPLKSSVAREQLFDVKALTAVRLRRKNIYGHSSDSTIQTMMYGEKSVSAPETPMEESNESQKPHALHRSKSLVTPYSESFDFKGKYQLVDITSPFCGAENNREEEDSIQEHLPLPVFVQKSLLEPLTSQIGLVNKALHDFYMVDLKIVQHLEILRSFFLLHDGEFAQTLSDQLFDKMKSSESPAELFNPVSLNSVLQKSINSSLQREHLLAKNFSFGLHSIPHVFPLHVAAPFEGLELHYKVAWPINIIITSSCLVKYNKLFRFLMQIRHALWALTDVFYHLKRHVRHQTLSPQFTQLQLFRHEMHHFARVLQAYISNQVLQVCWVELRHDLSSKVQTLDHLHDVHVKYLNRAMYRCLLHKKAAPVMRVIQMIMSIILKFHAQMISLPWKKNPETGLLQHPSFGKLAASYRIYQQYSGFLYKAWLHDAVGTLSHDEISNARVPAALERIFVEIQLQFK